MRQSEHMNRTAIVTAHIDVTDLESLQSWCFRNRAPLETHFVQVSTEMVTASLTRRARGQRGSLRGRWLGDTSRTISAASCGQGLSLP